MTTCPECGHPLDMHGDNGCIARIPNGPLLTFCGCGLTVRQAKRLAILEEIINTKEVTDKQLDELR